MIELNQNTLIKDSIEHVIESEKICPSFTKEEIEESCIQSLMTSEVVTQLMNDPVMIDIDIDQDEWDYYELNDKVNEMLDEYEEDLDEIILKVGNA